MHKLGELIYVRDEVAYAAALEEASEMPWDFEKDSDEVKQLAFKKFADSRSRLKIILEAPTGGPFPEHPYTRRGRCNA